MKICKNKATILVKVSFILLYHTFESYMLSNNSFCTVYSLYLCLYTLYLFLKKLSIFHSRLMFFLFSSVYRYLCTFHSLQRFFNYKIIFFLFGILSFVSLIFGGTFRIFKRFLFKEHLDFEIDFEFSFWKS